MQPAQRRLFCALNCMLLHVLAGFLIIYSKCSGRMRHKMQQHGSEVERLPEERQRAILGRLAREGRVVALELARQFRTSEDTIRRDLRELAAAGLCRRVYGGALPVSPASGALMERESLAPSRKQALGEKLVTLLRVGQVVFVDAGSTNLAAMRALPAGLRLTIVTNAPSIGATVAGRDGVQLVMTGGLVDVRAGAAFGAHALRDVADLRPDVYLLGICALDAQAGIAAFAFDEAEFKRTVVSLSRQVLAATTADKLGTAAPYRVADAQAIDDLVVEADTLTGPVAELAELGVRIHHADKTQEG